MRYGMRTNGARVDIAAHVLCQGGPPVFIGEVLDSAGDTWVSKGEGCVCPGQPSISYPHVDVDTFWRAGFKCIWLRCMQKQLIDVRSKENGKNRAS